MMNVRFTILFLSLCFVQGVICSEPRRITDFSRLESLRDDLQRQMIEIIEYINKARNVTEQEERFAKAKEQCMNNGNCSTCPEYNAAYKEFQQTPGFTEFQDEESRGKEILYIAICLDFLENKISKIKEQDLVDDINYARFLLSQFIEKKKFFITERKPYLDALTVDAALLAISEMQSTISQAIDKEEEIIRQQQGREKD